MIKLLFVDRDYMMSDGVAGEILLDLNDGTNYTYMLNTFKPRPADQRQSTSDSPFKDGTTYRPGLGKLEDVILPFSIKVIGDEVTSAKDKLDVVLNEARKDTVYVVYAPDYDSPVTFYSAHPAVSLDTDTFWFREYQNANLAVVDFDLLAGCGFGTVETLAPIQNLAPNPSFDRWSYVTDRVMSMDGTTAIKDIINDTAFTMAGAPTTTALLGAIAPVIGAAAYTSCKIPTATIGLTPGEDISLVFAVNTSWAGDDGLTHELFCSDGAGDNMFRVAKFNTGEITVLVSDADGDAKEKYMAVNATNWAANTDHIIVVTVTDGDIQRIFLDGVEGTGSASYGTPVRESALDANLYVGVYYDGGLAFTLDGAILCALLDRILTDAEIAVLSGLTNWANAPDDWTVKTGGTSTITEEVGTFLYGSASAKFVRNGGDCEMQTTGYITVNPDDPFYLDGFAHSAAALGFTLEAMCYKSDGTHISEVSFTGATRGATEWDREVMYLYHHGDITKYYIAAADWPALTAKIRIRASLNENGTVYLDSVIFGNVKYIPDHAIDGVVGLRIYDTKGDLPALCSLYVSNLLFEPGWRTQDSSGAEDINGVDAFNAAHVYAVGDEGHVFFYNGVLWVTQDSGVSVPLNAVSAFDSTRIWAVGDDGTIRFSDDSSTWSGQTCPVASDLMGVFAITATNIVAVGAGGLIVKSADGTTWTQKTSGTTNRLNAVHADAANRIYAVGDDGTILTSADGNTWVVRISGTTKNLYGVYALDATHAWAVGQDGMVLFSADAGATWTQQPSPVSETLHGVWAASEYYVWISGDRGKILFGSSLWEVQAEGSPENLNGISGFDDINVWAVGADGMVLKGVYPGGALGITDLIIGEGNAYHEDYNPMVECGEGDLAYSPYRRWGTYRVLDADEFNDFLFNLASYAGGSYAIAAGLSFSASTVYDKGTIRKFLQTPTGMEITAQYLEDEIDLGDPNTKWREVLLQDDMWDDIPVPTHVVSDEAGLGNIDQVVEVRAHTSLGAAKEWLDYLGLMPVDRFVNIGSIDTGCLIIDSVMGVVFDSLLGGPSTAMVHDPTESPDTPRFFMDREGTNFTVVAINDVSDDQRVGMVNLTVKYRPRYKLFAS